MKKWKFIMPDIDYLKEIEILKYLEEQISAIETFTSGFDEDKFLRDELVKNATLMKLLVFGEYSAHVDEVLKNRFTEIQWQLIKAARNYYAHVYRGIDWVRVWEVVNQELPGLRQKIENIISILEKENNAKIN
jgi:uncharacterized protein with HEPN domain